ncbi:MAG: AAA family ATPase [Verrucomicrobiales bacterium]|nr:AAA family ATPase [Verrucomicrobiales bacterium]
MNDEIHKLIEILRRGEYEDSSEKIEALGAALREAKAGLDELRQLLGAPQVPLRLAAIHACIGTTDPEVPLLLEQVALSTDSQVRGRLAYLLGQRSLSTTEAGYRALLQDPDSLIRGQAVKAVAGQAEFVGTLRDLALKDPDWDVREHCMRGLGVPQDVAAVAHGLEVLAEEAHEDTRQIIAKNLELYLAAHDDFDFAATGLGPGILIKACKQLGETPGRHPITRARLEKATETAVDPAALARFGVDLTAQIASGALPCAFEVAEALQVVIERLERAPSRAIALIGPSGCGKTALIHALVRELAKPERGGWRVLRMSPADFLSGTKYVGEWETRLRDLIATIRHPRRVVLYVPNVADLAAVGRWEKSDANVVSALAPQLEDGSIHLIGEATPEDFERGLGREPALSRLFERVLLEPATPDRTRLVLRALRDQAGAPLSNEVIDQLFEASESFLNHVARPGAAAGLLRAVLDRHSPRNEPIQRREILETLAHSTGVPVDLLDDATPLDLPALNAFFESRIMGQPDAVQAVVDLVTLVKAGLTDPNKPFGVMLFVGPTGVGKTELARILAEYVFGDPARLLRFDMSEFAGAEGFTRLIGGRGENGLLTDAIRQRPFSVVLLDEIEKSHLNVFDLCLQIFDAGRLTDGHGRLVDFRRSIVILTSNIGAELPGATVGFGTSAAQNGGAEPGNPDAERTFRELSRFFRPEFLNRIDRIVHFRPLGMDVAERIARREVDLVLRRSGVTRRGISVAVDPEVIALLVKEGYSPSFGARPLKRTVERLLLQPLAQALATGRLGPGHVVSLRAHARRIDVAISRPLPPDRPSSAPALNPHRHSTQRRVEALTRRGAELDERLASHRHRRSELVNRTQQPGFYQDRARSEAVFDELSRLEAFLTRAERLRSTITSFTLDPGQRTGAGTLDDLDAELDQIAQVLDHPGPHDLDDVLLAIQPARTRGAALNGLRDLLAMYVGAATRHHLTGTVLAESSGTVPSTVYLLVTGMGAHALFAQEHGLHEFRRRGSQGSSRKTEDPATEPQEWVSVEVRPWAAPRDSGYARRVTRQLTACKPGASQWLPKATWRVTLFDETAVRSLDVVVVGVKETARDTAAAILWNLTQPTPCLGGSPAQVIRRYDLGRGAVARDLRTGASTSRLAHLFRGQIELLGRWRVESPRP